MLLSVSLCLCHYLILCKKADFFLTSAVLVQLFSFSFSREQCGGKRCNRDWGRRWGRWEVELKGVMDERERWEETRRPLGVASSSSSNCRDMEYCSIINATRKHWKSVSLCVALQMLLMVPSSPSRLWVFLAIYMLNKNVEIFWCQTAENTENGLGKVAFL